MPLPAMRAGEHDSLADWMVVNLATKLLQSFRRPAMEVKEMNIDGETVNRWPKAALRRSEGRLALRQ
jgi:hypothetical protein